MAGGSVPAEVMSVVNACNNLSHWSIMDFTEDYEDTDVANALAVLVDALGVLMTPQDVLTIVLDASVAKMGAEAVSDVVSGYVVA